MIELLDMATHRCIAEDIPMGETKWTCKACNSVWLVSDTSDDILVRVGTISFDHDGLQILPRLG